MDSLNLSLALDNRHQRIKTILIFKTWELRLASQNELIRLADGGRDPSDGEPGVEDGLASGDRSSGLVGAVLEAAHHQRQDRVALLLRHLRRNCDLAMKIIQSSRIKCCISNTKCFFFTKVQLNSCLSSCKCKLCFHLIHSRKHEWSHA